MMIGHQFASSGATALAFAPGRDRHEYVVLARFEDQYVVATLDAATLAEPGGPTYWTQGDYFTGRDTAVEEFARLAGLGDVPLLGKQVLYAEEQIARVSAPQG